eukprot:7385943-Prymnesium_polylepis.1
MAADSGKSATLGTTRSCCPRGAPVHGRPGAPNNASLPHSTHHRRQRTVSVTNNLHAQSVLPPRTAATSALRHPLASSQQHAQFASPPRVPRHPTGHSGQGQPSERRVAAQSRRQRLSPPASSRDQRRRRRPPLGDAARTGRTSQQRWLRTGRQQGLRKRLECGARKQRPAFAARAPTHVEGWRAAPRRGSG